MSDRVEHPVMHEAFPRYFKIAGHWVNSYKIFLCVGLYMGTLACGALAQHSGLSPLRVGLGALSCALAGLFGARVYHLLVHAEQYRGEAGRKSLWDGSRGGWSVFGALLTLVPMTFVVAWLLRVPAAAFWDHLGAGILAGGFWVRLGCVFNGCCVGRETQSPLGVHLHDIQCIRKRRIPVQFMEMAWWLLGGVLFLLLWTKSYLPGSYALGVLAWYGVGRFFLEPLRERPDVIMGRWRINQIVAGALALGAGGALVLRQWLAS
ncbi:prolipoprotein diacylglyceryltransferase [Roseimicrobium gellanilyticum]|uniref:Prolipoprotein diacylglyceryltransferase n=1 Tax=Roseimicrobium gellanilyticum TaxID=748857 RepID=A0A366HS50_9BACT|nr:prolipoprotein diacylglyceryl transferase family protein [Roseimicrobium gellanilyticum]RBP45372.1 prolipoprotein diacylglyceryltransferase [Roseimicrobium gellanilyticum]